MPLKSTTMWDIVIRLMSMPAGDAGSLCSRHIAIFCDVVCAGLITLSSNRSVSIAKMLEKKTCVSRLDHVFCA